MRTKSAVALAVGLVFLLVQAAGAAEIRVICSNGVKAVLEDLGPQFERTSGHKLNIQFSSTATLKQRIDGGEAFDVAFLTSDAIDDLIQSGKLAAATRADLARTGIGVGYRKGAPKPDVATAAAIKALLLRAQSIAYTRDGASRPGIDKMFDRLGIAADVRGKSMLQAAGQAPGTVARGEAEIVLTLISEILPVAGVELAGPLPAEFQNYTSFAAAAATEGGNAQAVQALIKFVAGPTSAPVFKAKGMEPR